MKLKCASRRMTLKIVLKFHTFSYSLLTRKKYMPYQHFTSMNVLLKIKDLIFCKSILIDLITNAIKFISNGRKPIIKMMTTLVVECVCLEVGDNG